VVGKTFLVFPFWEFVNMQVAQLVNVPEYSKAKGGREKKRTQRERGAERPF
jgi:hypothetical protein